MTFFLNERKIGTKTHPFLHTEKIKTLFHVREFIIYLHPFQHIFLSTSCGQAKYPTMFCFFICLYDRYIQVSFNTVVKTDKKEVSSHVIMSSDKSLESSKQRLRWCPTLNTLVKPRWAKTSFNRNLKADNDTAFQTDMGETNSHQ